MCMCFFLHNWQNLEKIYKKKMKGRLTYSVIVISFLLNVIFVILSDINRKIFASYVGIHNIIYIHLYVCKYKNIWNKKFINKVKKTFVYCSYVEKLGEESIVLY